MGFMECSDNDSPNPRFLFGLYYNNYNFFYSSLMALYAIACILNIMTGVGGPAPKWEFVWSRNGWDSRAHHYVLSDYKEYSEINHGCVQIITEQPLPQFKRVRTHSNGFTINYCIGPEGSSDRRWTPPDNQDIAGSRDGSRMSI